MGKEMTQWGRMSLLLEIALGFIALVIVVALWLPYFIKPCSRSRTAEVKANVHAIQIGLERYYTDHGEYPAYLLGGSNENWDLWHEHWDGYCDWQMADGRIASNDIVHDELIERGYLAQYPLNPFSSTRRAREYIALVASSGPRDAAGFEPRFGREGNLMGMTLDDPRYFCGSMHSDPSRWSEVETRRTLDRGDWMKVPDEFRNPGTSGYYLSGGRYGPDRNQKLKTWWPGTFYYRSLPDLDSFLNNQIARHIPGILIGASPQTYIIGGFGDERTPAQDVIRLEPYNSNGELVTWRFPEGSEAGVIYCDYGYPGESGSSGGLPEVFGGGDNSMGPQYPPFYRETGDVLFGAPDGIPDGVIIMVTSGRGF